jgi:transcriptional regulator with XRE-family HTH domain
MLIMVKKEETDMIVRRQVGQRIRELREIQHYTREGFAAKIEMSTKYLYEIEAGRKGVSAEILSKIAVALSVSTDYILFGIDSGNQSTEKVLTVLEGMDVQQKAKIHEFIVTVDELLRD